MSEALKLDSVAPARGIYALMDANADAGDPLAEYCNPDAVALNPLDEVRRHAWQHQPADYEMPSREYPLAGNAPNVSHRRINYTTLFLAALAVFWALSALYGAGCFDRFVNPLMRFSK
jgi:hypothetical protein